MRPETGVVGNQHRCCRTAGPAWTKDFDRIHRQSGQIRETQDHFLAVAEGRHQLDRFTVILPNLKDHIRVINPDLAAIARRIKPGQFKEGSDGINYDGFPARNRGCLRPQ